MHVCACPLRKAVATTLAIITNEHRLYTPYTVSNYAAAQVLGPPGDIRVPYSVASGTYMPISTMCLLHCFVGSRYKPRFSLLEPRTTTQQPSTSL